VNRGLKSKNIKIIVKNIDIPIFIHSEYLNAIKRTNTEQKQKSLLYRDNICFKNKNIIKAQKKEYAHKMDLLFLPL
jgi:hypothetical protein